MLNFPGTKRLGRAVIVAMTLLGWLVLSNHCALGRIAQVEQARKGHSCCQNGLSKPAGNPAEGKWGVECCKSLHVVMPDGVKHVDLAPPGCVIAVLAAVFTLDARTEEHRLRPVDTGPPRAASFSELVLHRSLRSHAPPFLA